MMKVKKIFCMIATLFFVNELMKLVSLLPVFIGMLVAGAPLNGLAPIYTFGGKQELDLFWRALLPELLTAKRSMS